MKKNLIIISSSEKYSSHWKSMKVILKNFDRVLESLEDEFHIYNFKIDFLDQNIDISHIDKSLHTHFLYMCSKIDFSLYIEQLSKAFYNREHHFVVFGNLTTRPYKWFKYSELLSCENVSFICASKSTSIQLEKLISNTKVSIIPYLTNSIFYDQDLEQTSLSNTFGYAGRLVSAKNIFKLIEIFKHPLLKDKKLLIAGFPDTFSFRLHGLYNSIDNTINQLNELPKNIIFLGELNPLELKEFHKQYGCFISLSTFFDEDFGISTLEALLSGKDAILSQWGGHRDFIQNFNTQFVCVNREDNIPTIDSNLVVKEILKFSKRINDESYTKAIDKDYSLKAITSKWRLHFKSPALQNGICPTKLYECYFEEFTKTNSQPFREMTSKTKRIYSEIYDEY
jgi:glycosyltransferase involved in cell wall biosynthesis